METEVKTDESLVRVPERGFLALVAAKLKDRNLFPEKVEEAKEYLRKVTLVRA
jgi:hypothetical protein